MPNQHPSPRTFLHWLQELSTWYTAAQTTSSREAARRVLGNEYPDAWLEEGRNFMDGMVQKHGMHLQLVQWLSDGVVDPVLALLQMEYNNLSCTGAMAPHGDMEDDEIEYELSLPRRWLHAASHALMRSTHDLHSNDYGIFLHRIISVFNPNDPFRDPDFLQLGQAQEAWLRNLCTRHAWARDQLATDMLCSGNSVPHWDWVFGEDLRQSCSRELVEAMLRAVDEHNNGYNYCHNEKYHNIQLFAVQAPKLVHFLKDTVRAYDALWGPAPHKDSWQYMDDRLTAIHALVRQEPALLLDMDQLVDTPETFR